MEHFESIVATLLEADHYWVRRSFKVELTKEEKRQVGKPSMPRLEIDLLAFQFSKNEVIAFEAKSFLNSLGVRLVELLKKDETAKGRYKLFTSKRYRRVVLRRLRRQLIKSGMANSETRVFLGLAAGKIHMNQTGPIRELMEKNNWRFWSPEDIKEKVEALARRGYENDPAIITAKILKP